MSGDQSAYRKTRPRPRVIRLDFITSLRSSAIDRPSFAHSRCPPFDAAAMPPATSAPRPPHPQFLNFIRKVIKQPEEMLNEAGVESMRSILVRSCRAT